MPVEVRVERIRIATDATQNDAELLLNVLGYSEAELSIVLCDDPFIRKLNRQYRHKDQPTDVLSFAMQEGQTQGMQEAILGDIIISLDTARRQAAEQGHPVATELRILLVHGLLHLLGYDHILPGPAAEMRAKEQELLAALTLSLPGLIARA